MIVVWGSKLYGKVDEIAGVGHVATKFGHLFWIPLIPMNSFFVTDETRHNFEGIPLGLSMKSVLVAYARAFSILFFLGALGAVNALFNPQEVVDPERITAQKTTIILGLFSIPMFFAAYHSSVRFASYETAREMATTVNLSERLRVYIEYCYDKISETEAEERMDALDSEIGDCSPSDEDPEMAEIYKRYASA